MAWRCRVHGLQCLDFLSCPETRRCDRPRSSAASCRCGQGLDGGMREPARRRPGSRATAVNEALAVGGRWPPHRNGRRVAVLVIGRGIASLRRRSRRSTGPRCRPRRSTGREAAAVVETLGGRAAVETSAVVRCWHRDPSRLATGGPSRAPFPPRRGPRRRPRHGLGPGSPAAVASELRGRGLGG